jgi:hypothetical protein
MRIIADIETDGLLDTITKIHCFCYQEELSGSSGSITDYKELTEFLEQPDLVIIGHNFTRFDKPALEKILDVKFGFKVIDTLPLSWTIYTQYSPMEHSLDDWGERLGIKKPEINDWNALPVEEYIHRCSEDVKINARLWQRQHNYLLKLYGDEKEIDRYCAYLSFKMDCMREQEEIGIKLDVSHVNEMFVKLSKEKEGKISLLKENMPRNPLKKKKVYKDAIRDKNGAIYMKGDLFYAMIDTDEMPKDITVETITGYEDPNPNSHTQIKNWLYSLGWVPENIKHVRDKETNEVKKIPQISSKNVPGEVCESVKKLFEKEPKLETLNGLAILSHRIGIFEGFKEEQINGRLYPTCVGLTNTLRLQHRVVVNLPGFDKKYGTDVRGSLIADDGMMLCGSDLSGIEDNTKRHYIYKYDPDYVSTMSTEGYDAHLELGILVGFITKDESEFYKWYSTK